MQVGVFISEANRMLLDLVVGHLSRQADLRVVVLSPDPAFEGRAPLDRERCRVIVFAPSEDGPRGVRDLRAGLGQSCLELRDCGRAAVAWTVHTSERSMRIEGPEALADAVRRAGAAARPT